MRENIIVRFETLSSAQQYMDDEAYEQAEKWLNEHQDEYIKTITNNNINNKIQ